MTESRHEEPTIGHSKTASFRSSMLSHFLDHVCARFFLLMTSMQSRFLMSRF
jgi:hypothetical protein